MTPADLTPIFAQDRDLDLSLLSPSYHVPQAAIFCFDVHDFPLLVHSLVAGCHVVDANSYVHLFKAVIWAVAFLLSLFHRCLSQSCRNFFSRIVTSTLFSYPCHIGVSLL